MTDTNTTPPAEAESLGIGNIISETFNLFGRNFPFFFGVAAVPYFVLYMIMLTVLPGIETATDTGAILAITFGTFAIIGLGYIFIQGVMVRCAVALKTGHGRQLNEAVAAALRGFLPILLLGIVYSLGMMFGFLLLIVPGFIVMAIFYVYIPAIVFENKGFGALGRSDELTKGYRAAIVGVVLLLGVIIWIVSIVFGVMMAFVVPSYAAGGMVTTWLGALLEAVLQGVTLPLSMIATALVFVRLREIKEGGAAEDLVRVFE